MLQPRSIVARPVALLLTVGVLSVGLAACGSSSSTSSSTHAKRSSSSVVKKKEASLFTDDMYLTVLNNSSKTILVTLCGDQLNPTCHDKFIDSGDSDYTRGGSTVAGKLTIYAQQRVVYPDGSTNNPAISNQVDVYAKNPDVGKPWLSVLSRADDPIPLSSDPGGIKTWSLDENQAVGVDIGENGFTMSRATDTDCCKVMKLTVDR
jgi:hypothetical protein